MVEINISLIMYFNYTTGMSRQQIIFTWWPFSSDFTLMVRSSDVVLLCSRLQIA